MVDARTMTAGSRGKTAQFEFISCLLASNEPDRVTGAATDKDTDKFSSV